MENLPPVVVTPVLGNGCWILYRLPKVFAHNGSLLLLILTPAALGAQWRRVFSEIPLANVIEVYECCIMFFLDVIRSPESGPDEPATLLEWFFCNEAGA